MSRMVNTASFEERVERRAELKRQILTLNAEVRDLENQTKADIIDMGWLDLLSVNWSRLCPHHRRK